MPRISERAPVGGRTDEELKKIAADLGIRWEQWKDDYHTTTDRSRPKPQPGRKPGRPPGSRNVNPKPCTHEGPCDMRMRPSTNPYLTCYEQQRVDDRERRRRKRESS